ncbi:MAG: hypothetical protein AAF645_30685 [Myxococcota bacterium]
MDFEKKNDTLLKGPAELRASRRRVLGMLGAGVVSSASLVACGDDAAVVLDGGIDSAMAMDAASGADAATMDAAVAIDGAIEDGTTADASDPPWMRTSPDGPRAAPRRWSTRRRTRTPSPRSPPRACS